MHPYFGAEIAFPTKHGKIDLIAKDFKDTLNIELVSVNLDTDVFGTFSGEIERQLSPLETAIAKAKAGAQESGLDLAIASEGTIGNDFLVPFVISDVETIALADIRNNLVISETCRSFNITAVSEKFSKSSDLDVFLKRADFPNHKLIVKPDKFVGELKVIKGIGDFDALRNAIDELSNHSLNGTVAVESDFRAHNSLTRQKNIRIVARQLITRITNLCEKCDTPGFGKITYLRGLKCTLCGIFDDQAIQSELLTCISCDHQLPGKLISEALDPARCNWCNP